MQIPSKQLHSVAQLPNGWQSVKDYLEDKSKVKVGDIYIDKDDIEYKVICTPTSYFLLNLITSVTDFGFESLPTKDELWKMFPNIKRDITEQSLPNKSIIFNPCTHSYMQVSYVSNSYRLYDIKLHIYVNGFLSVQNVTISALKSFYGDNYDSLLFMELIH